MSNIKRLNLYFNLDNAKTKEAYEIISNSMSKTAFIVDAVLAYKDNTIIDKSIIKEAVKEAFLEMDYNLGVAKNTCKQESNEIPDDVFNMITNL